MKTPVRISFQGSTPSESLTTLISEQVDILERLHGRLTSCQIVVQVPDRNNRSSGLLYSVNIHVVLPGNIDVNVDHTPQGDSRFADPIFAVNDSFRRAKRLIKEKARKQRGEVKNLHERFDRTLDRPPN